MGADSKIEWTHHTFNPVRGCRKLSAGCAHCYAESLSKRNPALLGSWGPDAERVFAAESYWADLARWDRAAAVAGEVHRVFVASLADIFEGEPLPGGEEGRTGPRADYLPMLERLAEETERLPSLRFLVLTKRPWNAVAWMQARGGKWPARWWFGVSVENQDAADTRIPYALKIPARVRFLSLEPLLGAVNLSAYLGECRCNVQAWEGAGQHAASCPATRPRVCWAICGGESGPKARPMHPDWARSIRDQCARAEVPFLFKQVGEWRAINQMQEEEMEALYRPNRVAKDDEDQGELNSVYGRTCTVPRLILRTDGNHRKLGDPESFRSDLPGWPAVQAYRVGKKDAGRLLDGVEHNAFPAP
jgi:protein gp37